MKNFVLLMILCLSISLNAQIMWDEEVAVRQGENIEWFRSSAAMEDGSVVYVWSDTRFGDRDVFAQRMDADGNKLWDNDAVQVNGEINRQEDPVVISATDGGLVIAWVDFRNEDSGDVYAQKLDENGNLLWNAAGVPLCLVEDIQISLNIVPDNSGGAYVIWLDSRNTGGSDIYGTHILSNGTIESNWDVGGEPIAATTGDQNQHTFWQDGTGGAILAWHDNRNPNDEDIYIQRIASNGDLLWDVNGSILVNADGTQEKPKITPDGTGNFIFSWRDKRDDAFGDIYAQRVDLDGELLWANEIVVYAGIGVQRNPRVKTASDGGAFVVWEDGRNEISEEFKDIYVQKLNTDGDLLWNNAGLPIALDINDQINPRITNDDNGGCWIIWEDGRTENHPYGDIYVQHINNAGVVQLDVNGKEICTEVNYQFSPVIKSSQNNQFIVWGDNRDGSTGIYIQVLNSSGINQLEENGEIIFYGLSGDALNHKFLYNGDEKVILWRDTRNASIATQIYMQVLNNDGSFGLIENGAPITEVSGFDHVSFDAVLSDNSDEVAFCWEENREGFKQIFTQALDMQGGYNWSQTTGIQISPSTAQQEYPQISYVNSSEYFIGWNDFTDFMDSRIGAQKIIDGELMWGAEGVVVVDGDGNDELTDLTEDYFIWQTVGYGNENIYCKRIDTDGNTASGWDDAGLPICLDGGTQKNAKGIIVPEGILIIWDDLRNGDTDIYGQIVTPDGDILWQTDGIPLVMVENDQNISNVIYENNELFMVWEDFRNGYDLDIFMQKFNSDGEEIWQAGGLEVVSNASSQEAPYLTYNGEEFMIFWEDYISEAESNLRGQYFRADVGAGGVWQANGEMINNAIRNQNKPIAISEGEYAYVIWQDTRSSGKTDIYNIYAQKVNFDYGDAHDNEIPNVNTILDQNYPNPFNPTTTISFNVNANIPDNSKINIYNLKGQIVKQFELTEGQNSVQWNGKDANEKSVTSGIYFYRLESESFKSETRKMILIK